MMSIQSSQLILLMFLLIEDFLERSRIALKKKKTFEQNQVVEYCFDELTVMALKSQLCDFPLISLKWV